jgi:hypothetical protein
MYFNKNTTGISELFVISLPYEKKHDPMHEIEKVSMIQSTPYFSLQVHWLVRKINFRSNYI